MPSPDPEGRTKPMQQSLQIPPRLFARYTHQKPHLHACQNYTLLMHTHLLMQIGKPDSDLLPGFTNRDKGLGRALDR